MPEPAWQELVDSVLANVEADPVARERLKVRLREENSLGTLYSAWKLGGNATQIGRTLRRLAEQSR